MKVLQLWDNVNQYIIQSIIYFLNVEEKRSKEQIQFMKYSLGCLVNESGKAILLAIVFATQGCIDKYVIALLTIVSLRIFMGGSHRVTTMGCFLQSLFTFELIILLDSVICLNMYMNYSVWILMIVLIWKRVPIVSTRRAHYNKMQCMHFKMMAITTLFLQSIIIGLVSSNIANVMSWAIVIQLLEFSIVGIKLRKEEA